ncbi:Glucose/Sorbosone dehydrogenase [Gracilaria domingensis]|nr:Glucose/Sorbosone dehydrogenase [Gracilaria domingensis]
MYGLENTSTFNPVTKPIVQNAMDVHVERFAKIPDENGKSAAINSIVPLMNNLFVCTKTKIYHVSAAGNVTMFFDVQAAVQEVTGRSLSLDNALHGGVRSIAFHPSFRQNGLFYISAMEERPSNPKNFHYISDSPTPIDADSVLIEWRVDLETFTPVVNSHRTVFRVGMPVYDHPIKQIAFFGNLLYVAHGDGSVQSAIAGGGQRNDALGKVLRINPLKAGSRPYTTPHDNPFVGSNRYPEEAYAVGFRNPHHICFGTDGTLYAADTGRANIEEVNLVQPAADYGWPAREGTFAHKGGGLMSGVGGLPNDDAQYGFTYPAAQVGHDGPFGAAFIGQAIAGGCPIENGSPMSGFYYYADFPVTGKLYFSAISDIKGAVTNGDPGTLTQATTYQADIVYNGVKYGTLGEVMRSEEGFSLERRVDVRFGRGYNGELYWSSKRNGRVYLMTSSLPGGPGGPTYF